MKALVLLFGLLVSAMPAAANPLPEPPSKGVYTPLLLANSLYCESWAASGDHLSVGNIFRLFLGATEFIEGPCNDPDNGTWEISCPAIVYAPSLISDGRDPGGNGPVVWAVNYASGSFSISSLGPWANDIYAYTFPGELSRFQMVATCTYVNGEITGIEADISAMGEFEYYHELCARFEMHLVLASTTDDDVLPTEYPDFLDPTCNPGTRTKGSWGNTASATMEILDCDVPSENITWGQVKKIWGAD